MLGSLQKKDGIEWPDLTPFIASIFVLYRYRRNGIATKIIQTLEARGAALGHHELFLHSGAAADMYPNLGYTEVETIPKDNSVRKLTLFKKILTNKNL